MKSKFLQKKKKFSLTRRQLRQTIVIPTLTLIMMAAQLAPQLFIHDEEVLAMLDELPSTVRVKAAPLTEKELKKYPDKPVAEKDLPKTGPGMMNDERTLATVRGTLSTGKSEVYLTTKGYTNYPELRAALEKEYGEDFMLMDGPNTTASSSYRKWADILNSKSGRAKLAKIAAKYIPGIKESHAAAPEVALATYYGAINDQWNYVEYSNKETISRSQMCALVYRFWNSNWEEYDDAVYKDIVDKMGKDYKYNLYISSLSQHFIFNGKSSRQVMDSSATRKEVIYMAMETFHGNGWGMTGTGSYNEKAISEAKRIFKDLKNADSRDCLIAYRAYKLGFIKPDKNGNSNINKKCSMSLALRYVYQARGVKSSN